MSGVISAIVVLLIIGAVAALILVIASKYMSVPENEMFPATVSYTHLRAHET